MAKDFKQIIVTRLVNAPVQIVWTYWSVGGMVQKWWGPGVFHIEYVLNLTDEKGTQEQSGRVMQAMMSMSKLEIEGLQKAFSG